MNIKLKKRQRAWKSGVIAEKIAMIFLVLKGYKILHHRYKTPMGEIDIIAKKSQRIHCIEVKKRPSMREALESVSIYQRRRIENATRYFCANSLQILNVDISFDIVLISPMQFPKHMKNVWIEGE